MSAMAADRAESVPTSIRHRVDQWERDFAVRRAGAGAVPRRHRNGESGATTMQAKSGARLRGRFGPAFPRFNITQN
jgi:hypothetical protein